MARRTGNKSLQAKLVLLGDMGTGKTSLVLRFVKGQFSEYQESTIGAAFFTQVLSLNEATVKFDIWDTAGQERYHSLAPMYYRGAAAAIVVYDITSMDSFVRAKKWVREVQRQANSSLTMFLVANKADLEDDRKVCNEEGEEYARESGLSFLETSAKTAQNVNELFYEIAKRLAKANPSRQSGIKLHTRATETRRGYFCCGLIPIIPIEEEESMDILPEVAVAGNPFPSDNPLQYISAETSIRSPSNSFYTDSSDHCTGIPLGGVSFGLEADLAASVVATIMRSSEQGSPIDMDLLVKIFNDPKILDKLINEHRTAATTISASSSTVDTTPGVKPAIPVLLSTSADVKASGATHTSAVGSLPFGLKTANSSVAALSPTPDKPATLSVPAIPSVSLLSSAHDNPVTASVPMSRPVSGKRVTPSVSLLTNTPASHIPRSASNQIHHVSSGISPALNTQYQQDTALASGPKRAAAVASVCSGELSTLSTGPLPSLTRNLHAVVNPVQSTASTLPYKLSTGSSAFAVKDANYYKNLIRQHGADKQDMQDPHIGIRHSNLQDMKPVHNFKEGEVKHKIQKPCIYFKSSKGCRNGFNCPYQHDVSAQWGAGNILGSQSAKRLKSGP